MAYRTVADRPLLDLLPLREIMRDQSPLVVIQKSAQIGLTELAVSKALWAASTGVAGRGNVLYLMPTDQQMRDFAQTRVDQAIQGSPHLQALLRPEPPGRRGADSTRVKQFPAGALYMRGSESGRNIASIDADLVILDEFDQMNTDAVLARARRRVASSRQGQIIIASTPRHPETGVNGLYLQSDRHRYWLPCLACGLEQPLTFEHNVDRERMAIVCRACRALLDVLTQGRWVAEAPGNAIRGYHLGRLYSQWCDLPAMIEASEAPGLHAAQAFWNEDLGEVFSPPGGSLTLDLLDRCRVAAGTPGYAGEETVMGVDVGRALHVVIRRAPPPPPAARPRRPLPYVDPRYVDTDTGRPPPGMFPEYWSELRQPTARAPRVPGLLYYAGTVSTFEELDELMRCYHVRVAVVDALPETRPAVQFAQRHPGKVRLARYDRHDTGIERDTEAGTPFVHADRTYVMDMVLETFRDGTALLPADARSLGGRVRQGWGEYYRQMLAPKRVIETDAGGTAVARWVESGDDHFAHAEVYALLAAGG